MAVSTSFSNVPDKPGQIVDVLPTATRLQRLPVADLRWEDLEVLCVRLAKRDSNTEHAQSYGVRGQNQEGIDLYVCKSSNGRYDVWQCKRYKQFTKTDLRNAIAKFLKNFRGKNPAVPIKEADGLVLVVTADLSETSVANEIEKQRKALRRFRLFFKVFDAQGLSDELKKHPDIVEDFFHPAWVSEFCGKSKASNAVSDFDIAVMKTALRTAQEGLSSSGNSELDRIRDIWGQGRDDEALREITRFCTSSTWSLLAPGIRAKSLRMEAGLRLWRGEIQRANQALEESRRLASDENTRTLEAKFVFQQRGPEAALALLDSPKNDDELVLRWNLLLELGRAKEVTDEWTALKRKDIPSGDFASSIALAKLAQRDLAGAGETIQAALREKPLHLSCRHVGALVDYYHGLSIAFEPWLHLIWPVPVQWNLVKRDEKSVRHRETAAKTFEALANTPRGKESGAYRVWQLACLCLNLTDKRQLNEIVTKWLKETPKDVPLLAWATAQNLEFDKTMCIASLTECLDSGKASIEEFLALINLLDADSIQIEELLKTHRQLFIREKREHLWYFHKAEVLVERGQILDATKVIEEMPHSAYYTVVQKAVLQLIANHTGRAEDYERAADAQKKHFEETKNPDSLLDCCRSLRLLGRWDFIAAHAVELVRSVGTQSALEIAAESLLRTSKPLECLQLLKTHQSLCPGSEWSQYLRHVAAECYRLTRDLPSAISQLEKAVAEGGGVPALLHLFQMQVQMGDLHSSLLTARTLSKTPGVPHEFLVANVIPIVRHHDIQLAKEIVQQIISGPTKLSPEVEMKLVDEGFRLGIEGEVGDLLSKLTSAAVTGEGPLKLMTLEQARKMFADERQIDTELWNAYAHGEIPVHMLVARLHLPLATLFYERPRQNIEKRHPGTAPPLFTRYAHDVNQEAAKLPSDAKGIFLDLTSLLLLDQFGLLSKLECVFESVYIGASSVIWLEKQLDQLSIRQPSRSGATKEAVNLVNTGKIRISSRSIKTAHGENMLSSFVEDLGNDLCSILEQLKSKNGMYVSFLPLHGQNDVTKTVVLPEDYARSIIPPDSLVMSMEAAGWISAAEADVAKASLAKTDGIVSPDIPLTIGMSIHLGYGQAEGLALAKVLPILCERTLVSIDEVEADRLRHQANQESINLAVKQDVQRTLAHIARRIDQGKYRVHTLKSPPPQQPDLPPEESALYETIDFAQEENLPVSIDDRNVRQHQKIGKGATLCDCWDILHFLRDRKAIDFETFLETRMKMRMANLCFLPINEDEIIFYIKRATLQKDFLQESVELSCLRRYVARSLYDNSILQRPLREPNGTVHFRESSWAVRLHGIFRDVLLEIWREADIATNHAELQSDWIWHNLAFDLRLLAQIFGQQSPEFTPLKVRATSIGLLYGMGITIHDKQPTSGGSRRKKYFQWLTDRVVTPILANTPEIWELIAVAVRDVVARGREELKETIQKKGDRATESRAWRFLLANFVADLPPRLAHGLQLGAEGLQELGLSDVSPSVEILGLTFPSAEFWQKVSVAMKKQHATLTALDKKTRLRFRYRPERGQLFVSASDKTTSEGSPLNVPCLQLLSPEVRKRESALRQDSRLFDMDELKLTEAIRLISTTSNPVERVAKREMYLDNSAVALYEDVRRRLSEKNTVTIEELMPERVECLSRYLRLEPEDTDPAQFASRLLESVGFAETIVRLSRLPIHLPEHISSEWSRMTDAQQDVVLNDLRPSLITPIERIRLVELLCSSKNKSAERLAEAKQHIVWLCDVKRGFSQGTAMMSVVNWAHLRLAWNAESSKWPAFFKLCVAWSHGCAIHQAFQSMGDTTATASSWFAGHSDELLPEYFLRGDQFLTDAANPISLRYLTLLLKGLTVAGSALDDSEPTLLEFREQLALAVNDSEVDTIADMWADRSLGSNLMNSYLVALPDEELKNIVGEDAFVRRLLFPARFFSEVALNTLQQNPHDIAARNILLAALGDRPIYPDFEGILPNLVSRIDFVETFRTAPKDCPLEILLMSRIAMKTSDPIWATKVWDEGLRLADFFAKHPTSDPEERRNRQHVALAFSELAVRLSATRESSEAGIQLFCERLKKLLIHWPEYARVAGVMINESLSRMPTNQIRGLPELQILFRVVS